MGYVDIKVVEWAAAGWWKVVDGVLYCAPDVFEQLQKTANAFNELTTKRVGELVGKIGQCEAYDSNPHGFVVRCKNSGRSMPLADDEKQYVLCEEHADREDLILPEEGLR